MGLRSWWRGFLRRRAEAAARRRAGAGSAATAAAPQAPQFAPGYPLSDWEEVAPYTPVDPADHMTACIVAAALAAGDYPESSWRVKRVLVPNPEYRRVAALATAVAAGASEKSSFVVKRVYKQRTLEETHHAS